MFDRITSDDVLGKKIFLHRWVYEVTDCHKKNCSHSGELKKKKGHVHRLTVYQVVQNQIPVKPLAPDETQ